MSVTESGRGGNHVGTRRSVGLYSEAGCVLCAVTVADPGGGGSKGGGGWEGYVVARKFYV